MMLARCLIILTGLLLATPAWAAGPYYASTTGSGTTCSLASPCTPLACQTKMQGSSVNKLCYLRAGTYSVSVASGYYLTLGSSDAGETWSYYPSDGVNSAIIDGGSTSSSTGSAGGGVTFGSGANDITWNGIAIQRFQGVLIYSTGGTRGTIINSVLNSTTNTGAVGIGFGMSGVSGGSGTWRIAHNYIYNTYSHGIFAFTDTAATPGGISDMIIEDNLIFNTCTNNSDCGGIYISDYANPESVGISIRHNYVWDVNKSGAGAGGLGIYLDDGVSNALVYGNIVGGTLFAAFQIHGGQWNKLVGNILDLPNTSSYMVFYQPSSSLNTPMFGNEFRQNVVLMNGVNGGTGFDGNSSPPNPMTIVNNLYFNYTSGDTVPTGGGGGSGSDSNPGWGNPSLACYEYLLAPTSVAYAYPILFPGVPGGGWGPPGQAVPQTGTTPSFTPNAC